MNRYKHTHYTDDTECVYLNISLKIEQVGGLVHLLWTL